MRSLFILTILSFQAVPVFAQSNDDWVPVVEASTGTVWKIRASDIANSTDQNPTVWVELDHTKDQSKPERTTKQLINFDCRNKSYQVISWLKYRANGTVIDSGKSSQNRFSHDYAPPDSVIEAAMLAACPATK
jgi:hypothetical protein